MEKCWFVLRQTDFPPPTIPQTDTEQAKGRLCLGHLIPSLKKLDRVLNPNPIGPDPYPADMPIYPSTKHSFKWTHTTGYDYSVSSNVQVPMGVVPGLDAKVDGGFVFRKMVSNYAEFDSMETYVVEPTMAYIDGALEEEPVEREIEKQRGLLGSLGLKGSWTLYMVSGVMIVRGARNGGREDEKKKGVSAGIGAAAMGVVEAGFDGEVNKRGGVKGGFGSASDFLFAVRLAKISMGTFGKAWEVETLNKGATYSLGKEEEAEGKIRLEDFLKSEGLDAEREAKLYRVGDDEVFVIQSDR